jgi:hypothetical protein
MSVSFPRTLTSLAVFRAVLVVSSFATGASFAGLTVIVTVTMLESVLPSFALYWKESGPL